MNEPKPLFDFSRAEAVHAWTAINDGVMGGVSVGSIEATQASSALFSGALSFENNGGFASIRSLLQSWNKGDYLGVAVRVRGDGRAYKLNLKTDNAFDGINFRVGFTTTRDLWRTWCMPFDEFRASFRGRVVPDAPAFDPRQIRSAGFMIADKQKGPFSLEIAWIAAYRKATP